MADAVVEPRPVIRYYCHRCSIEFEDVLQDYTCPYCAGGFIEQLDTSHSSHTTRTPRVVVLSRNNFSDANMSNTDDLSNFDESDENYEMTPPMLNDLAFLVSGGQLRNRNAGNVGTGGDAGGGAGGGTGAVGTGGGGAGGGAGTGGVGVGGGGCGGGAAPQPGGGNPRRTTLMEELVWMIGGARPETGAVTAGTPFVFVGAPGDYVFGGEGLDAVVTQLLGQLENAGPPPMPSDRLAALVDEPVSEEQAAANTACSVCWDNFALGETVCRLDCEHIFHSGCIRPWLQLHATCPICRRSLLPDRPAAPTVTVTAASATNTANTNTTNTTDSPAASMTLESYIPRYYFEDEQQFNGVPIGTSIAAALPRILLRRIAHHPGYRRGTENRDQSSSSASRTGSTPSVWTRTESTTNPNSSTSVSSILSDIERNYNMDLDMD